MQTAARIVTLIAALAGWACAVPTLSAQWIKVMPRGVPKTPSGTPNFGAPAPRTPDGKPDLSGVWESDTVPCPPDFPFCDDLPSGIPKRAISIDEKPPVQPWAEALARQRAADESKDDPFIKCLPLNPPRMWSWFAPQKLVQTPDLLLVLGEDNIEFRQIFLDGRKLPEDPQPTFKGYSVGRWEGDTLIIESNGFKDGLWLDSGGHPMTDQARLVEKIRRINYGNLEVETTVDDPKAYTRPFTVKSTMFLVINSDLIEYICNENERDRQHLVGAGNRK